MAACFNITQPDGLGSGIVNRALTRIADNLGARSAKVILAS